MSRPVLAAAAALLAALSPQGTAAAAAKRPYSIDAMLQVEDLGPAAFSPQGDLLVVVRRPGLEAWPDASVPRYWGLSFGRLVAADPRGKAEAAPLFAPEPGALYALVGFSPDGRYIAYYRALEGRLQVGVFDRLTGAQRVFDPPAENNGYHQLTPVWTDATHLAFAATAPGAAPAFSPYNQRGVAQALQKAWETSWANREVSASVYLSRPEEGPPERWTGRLLLADVGTGEIRKLADDLVSDLRLSPDGKRLAGLVRFRRREIGLDEPRLNWTNGPGALVVFDTATGARVDVGAGLDVFQGTAEWSPDSRRIGFFAWRLGELPATGLFRVYDVAAGSLATLPHTGLDLVSEREFGPPARPFRFVWLGDGLAVPARRGPPGDPTPTFKPKGIIGREMTVDPGRFDWWLLDPEAAPINLTAKARTVSPWAAGVTAGGAFLVLDDEVREIRRDGAGPSLAPGWAVEAMPEPRSGLRWGSGDRDPFGATVTYKARQGDRRALLAFDLTTRSVRRVEALGAGLQLLSLHQPSGLLAYERGSPDGSQVRVQGGPGGDHRVLGLNGFLADLAKPTVRAVRYRDGKGQPIESCLILPPGYAGGRLPTIVHAYPGSRPNCSADPDVRQAGYMNFSVMAAHGFLVINVASPMLATPEGGPLADMVAAADRAVDAAVEAGYADPDRLGLFGSSGSGFSGLWLAGHSRRYKALVSINGIADVFSHYFGLGLGTYVYPEVEDWLSGSARYETLGEGQFGLGFTPWDDPLFYWKVSPVAYVKQIDAPVLLVGTDMDTAGFSSQYDEMFVALRRFRKQVDYVKYWGEPHGPSSAANIRDLQSRTLAWFDRYLRPEAGAHDGR